MKINYEDMTIVFSPDDEGRIWVEPFTFVMEEALLACLLEGGIVRLTTEGATSRRLAGEQCDNNR